MKRFGLYNGGLARHQQHIDGDFIVQEGEYVKVMKFEPGDTGRSTQVAAIRLDRGQIVKEVPASGDRSI